jgi:FkbM family methyltransferase
MRGLKWIVGSAPHGAWLGLLERQKLAVFAADLRPGMVVWDVGANVGLYTLCAARVVGSAGEVVAFEPVSENLCLLRRHLALNSIENARVVPHAVLDHQDTVRFSAGDSASEWRVDPQGTRELTAIALDRWREQSRARAPNVMKIDVEGAEAFVLNGARDTLAECRPALFLAVHGETERKECKDILNELGYELEPWEAGEPIDSASEWAARKP